MWRLGVLALLGVLAQPLLADRQIDSSSCSPVVSIPITPPAEVTTWAFEERIGRLTPSNISGNGVWIEEIGAIRWGADLDPTSTTLSYALAGSDGTYTLSGEEYLDGRSVDLPDSQVLLTCDAAAAPEQVAQPALSQPTGTRAPLSVSISSNTDGATIYYTLDGSDPTTSSLTYSGPIDVTNATFVKAIAVKDGMLASQVVSAYYPAARRVLADELIQEVSAAVCEPVITVRVAPAPSIESYSVEIDLPSGMIPAEISDNGVWETDQQRVKWGAFQDKVGRNVSFKLTGPDGNYDLRAHASFDGYTVDIDGVSSVEQDCIPPMAEKPVLSPASGRVPVTVSMTSATEGAVIRYTLDGSEPTESSTAFDAPITINDPATLKAKAFSDGLEPSETAKGEYLTGARPKAIIVAGGGPYEGNALWPATLKVSQYAYNALMYQGYSKDDIWLISPVAELDFDGNGELDDVDADATSDNLNYAITEWAKDATDLIVYLTDHGGAGEFVLNNLGAAPDLVSVGQIDAWFDAFQTENGARITFIYDACQSGTFVEGLIPPEGANRIVLTSASNEPALFLEEGVLSFSYQFWAAVFYKGRFYDAFLAARNQVENDQRPLLDANGNGIANEKADRALVNDIVIGRGAVAASVPPELNDVSATQTLSGETSAEIRVGSITSLNPITRVWAVLVPPNFRARSADEPVTELPSFELTDADGDGSYSATYTQFSKNGTYKIQLYARDNQGVLSLPARTEVVQTQGEIVPNDAPTANGAEYSIDEDQVVEESLSASDPDGDALTYVITKDGTLGTVSLVDLTQGTFKYRPHANESGTDTFTFLVNDGNADSSEATVTISIAPIEDAPEARSVEFRIDAGATLEATLPGFDGDGDPLTYDIISAPSQGSLSLTDSTTGAFVYDSVGAEGVQTITYSVSDGKVISDPGTVTISINRSFNTAPVAGECRITLDEDTSTQFSLIAADAEGDDVRFQLIGSATSGAVTIDEDGTLTYTPNADFFGEDSFAFGVRDAYDEGDPGSCLVEVRPVNDRPIADPLAISVTSVDGLTGSLSATDVDSDTLTFSIVAQPSRGQLTLNDVSEGTFSYVPSSTENGSDSFSFKVSDGELESTPVEVQVALRLPQATLERTVSDGMCLADVRIDVSPVTTVKAYAVVETLPSGVEPEFISGNGIWESDSNTIRWGTFKDNQPRSFSYTFTGDDGGQAIAGIGSFDGWDQSVLGPELVDISCVGSRVETPVITPDSGSRVPLAMEITSATEGASIYYSLDGSEPNESATLYEGPVEITSAAKVRARGFKDGLYRSQEARAKFRPANPHKAIIVVGGPTETLSNPLWPATLLAAEHAYRALLYQGFEKDEIQLLAPTLDLDFDGNDEFDDVDEIATNASIEASFTVWASDAGDLITYIVGHGGEGRFQITLGEEILDVANLDSWLDAYQTTTGKGATLIYDACRSGSFLDLLLAPSGMDRIVVTSSLANEPAWFIDRGRVSFSYQFWSAIFGKANLIEAFRQSRGVMRRYQTAMIDTNGDGLPDTDEQLKLASVPNLGRGAISAAFEPQILGVTAPQEIGAASSATWTVQGVSAVNKLSRVWSVVLPPDSGPVDPDQPVLDAVEVDFTPNADGTYTVSYDGFGQDGVYQIIVYAKDDQSLISEPAYTAVSKGAAGVSSDTDGDGVLDASDLCPAVFDDQSDFDGDGVGDACDDDDDNDGALDAGDAFPRDASEQLDTDKDGIGNNLDDDDDGDGVIDREDADPLDASVSTGATDRDGDGISDTRDNCVAVSNGSQADNDGDGVGDACDNDDDNDGIPDESDANPFVADGTIAKDDADEDGVPDDTDNCPNTANSAQLDIDGDSTGDACDSDADNDGVENAQDAFVLDARGATDDDQDGMADEWEALNGLDSRDASDRYSDADQDGILAIEEFVQDSNPNAQDLPAQVLTAEGPGAVAPGDTGVWRVIYDATDGSQSVDGLSLAIFYDSSVVRVADVTGVQSFSGASLASPSSDAFNLDLDASTDTYIEANWSPSALPWPETLPSEIGELTLEPLGSLESGTTVTVQLRSLGLREGYGFSAKPITFKVSSATLDIDGDGNAEALTDGLLIIRRLFGFESTSLIAGAISGDATITSADAIAERVDGFKAALDVDANGKTEALTDGLLIIRRLFGFEGASLVSGAISPDGERQDAAEIAAYIDGLRP